MMRCLGAPAVPDLAPVLHRVPAVRADRLRPRLCPGLRHATGDRAHAGGPAQRPVAGALGLAAGLRLRHRPGAAGGLRRAATGAARQRADAARDAPRMERRGAGDAWRPTRWASAPWRR
ncbi:MAG: hypothetical protein MZW92_49840 [Comamonadaceae bacterium]|nr:hypothetical protein [Comamonadaceae bacterium]